VTKYLLVVGGAAGIGAAVAAGWAGDAVVWSRRAGVDAACDASVRDALAALVAERGPPWAVVQAVGDFEERPLLETEPELYDHLLRSNLTTTFCIVRHVVPAMVAAGCGGRVVLFAAAGVGRERAMRRAPVYFAIKEAVVALGRSLAVEVAGAGITVNTVSPGIIEHAHSHVESQQRMGPKVPMGRPGTPADVVPLVLHLLSEDAAYTTGAHITVDGALSL